MSYVFYYVWCSIVCAVILGLLLYNDYRTGNKQESQVIFGYTLMFHIMYFLADAVWVMVDGGVLPRSYVSMSVINYIVYTLTCTCTFFWFFYGELIIGNESVKDIRRRRLICAPIIVTQVIVLIAFVTGHAYYLMDNGHMKNAWLYYSVILVPVIYVIIISIHGIRYAVRERNYADRAKVFSIAIYPIVLLGTALVQLFFQRIPILCFGGTIALLYNYITSLESMISLDPLTQMNNRNQLNRFMTQAEEDHKKDADDPLSILMMDIDYFKTINDNYGHQEGDRALQIVAAVLKSAVGGISNKRPFLARYGGDEFIIAVHTEDERELSAFHRDIDRMLEAMCELHKLAYPLKMSIGISRFGAREDSIMDCIRRADMDLYQVKQRRKDAAR